MFERNDKALLVTRIIVIVVIGILAVASLIAGIWLAVDYDELYVLIIFVGWFKCWLWWVLAKLLFSYLVDVKVIRNKLYDESNDGLAVFLKSTPRSFTPPAKRDKREPSVDAQLKQLRRLLDSGVITREQYENRVEELTKHK